MWVEEVKTKYLKFSKYQEEDKKTYKVLVSDINEVSNKILAEIYFELQWRTYVFESAPLVVYDSKCLQEILDYINNLNQERKNG